MLGAPLYMSNDLRNISDYEKSILQNRDIIAVNQDSLGILGRRVQSSNNVDVWVRPLADGKFAVLYLNRNEIGSGLWVTRKLSDLLSTDTKTFTYQNVYDKSSGSLAISDELRLEVNPSGVQMVVLTPAN